jgi:hypothetical protein
MTRQEILEGAKYLEAVGTISGLRSERWEAEQILGKALGYPWYKDDPASFPDATEADGVCVGEHTVVTLAMEAAKRLTIYELHTAPEVPKSAEIADALVQEIEQQCERFARQLTLHTMRRAQEIKAAKEKQKRWG